MLTNILTYPSLGYPIFPCSQWDKTPLTPHGFKDASDNHDTIARWYERYLDCAWALATSSAIGIVDIDPRHGGDATWTSLLASQDALPITPITETGGGGLHYWFTFPKGTGCSAGLIGKGIDVKAEGGYVIIPPSKILIPEHGGRVYRFRVKPWETPIAIAPDWLIALLQKPKSKAKDKGNPVRFADGMKPQPFTLSALKVEAEMDLTNHPGSPEGERRITLLALVGKALANGMKAEAVSALASAWASKCTPFFEEWERHTVGLIRKEAGKGEGEHQQYAITIPPIPFCNSGGKEGTNSQAQIPERGELVPSFHTSEQPKTELGNGEGDIVGVKPTLKPEAYHGLFGEMLRAITPETEADPAGVQLCWLTMLGNICGRGSWVSVSATRHYGNLYLGIVGDSSDAKGETYSAAEYPFAEAEPLWAITCKANGIGSGEGLLERIADPVPEKGQENIPLPIPDKRLLLRISEFSRCFKLGRREGSTLSEIMREAWDGKPISIPNRRANSLFAIDYSVSVIGDITPMVLKGLLAKGGTEAFDGFANRFLWCSVKSQKDLPSGGSLDCLHPFIPRLKDVIAFGQKGGQFKRSAEAEALWEAVYGKLKRSGDSVPHTDRARPYVVRLSMLYAIADRVNIIGVEHLKAALAVWDYCRASAAMVFGGMETGEGVRGANPSPDPLWLRLLNAIQAAPGIAKGELLRAIREPAEAITQGLLSLQGKGLAYSIMQRNPNGGRDAERWYPGGEGEPEGEEGEGEHQKEAFTIPPSGSRNDGKEGINPPMPEAELVPSEIGKEGIIPPMPEAELVPSEIGKEGIIPLGETPKLVPSFRGECGTPKGEGERRIVGVEPTIEELWTDEQTLAFLEAM